MDETRRGRIGVDLQNMVLNQRGLGGAWMRKRLWELGNVGLSLFSSPSFPRKSG
jgi:hypothetical protein